MATLRHLIKKNSDVGQIYYYLRHYEDEVPTVLTDKIELTTFISGFFRFEWGRTSQISIGGRKAYRKIMPWLARGMDNPCAVQTTYQAYITIYLTCNFSDILTNNSSCFITGNYMGDPSSSGNATYGVYIFDTDNGRRVFNISPSETSFTINGSTISAVATGIADNGDTITFNIDGTIS